MLLAWIATACAMLPAPVEQDALELDATLENVYLERRLAFEQAWAAADEHARAAARDLLRREGAEPVASARALTEARALLCGARERSLAAQVAASLDLRVLPGALAANRPPGEEVVVRVLPVTTEAYRADLAAAAVALGPGDPPALSLVWTAPDGARFATGEEPFHPDALRLPGFELYVRTPGSAPGTWSLAPVVRLGEDAGEGVALSLECLPELFERFRLSAAHPPATQDDARRAERLHDALVRGLRDARHPDIGALLADDRAEPFAAYAPCPEDAAGAALELAPRVPVARRCVVVVADPLEDPAWTLVGRVGAAWAELAHQARARVIVTSLPLRNPTGTSDARDLLAALRAAAPEAHVTLVVQRAAWCPLRPGACDALVLWCADDEDGDVGFPGPVLACRSLCVDGDGTDGDSARFTAPRCIASAELPARLSAWWTANEGDEGR